jgi:glycosyltransferase involved in cell wall biosynthesis
MIKILILQDSVSKYNIPIYDILSQNYEITIGYLNINELSQDSSIKIKKFKFLRILNIFLITENIISYCKNFEIVIFPADMHHISFCILPFIPFRNFKVIAWTPGIRTSYKVRFDISRKKSFYDFLYGHILRKCDALIFYMNESKHFWNNFLDFNKIFVAHNTIDVNNNLLNSKTKKNTILFVGTLYKQKKIFELINAYKDTIVINEKFKYYKLEIIGDGEEFQQIKNIINDNILTSNIILRGKITSDVELAHAFNRAIICVSPDQAGLSVLLSMGYGVPFVTRHNSITGGERLNIINDVNGILYNNEEELRAILLDCFTKPHKFLNIGKNAYSYYVNNATILHMYQGFVNAIKFVKQKKP